MGALILRPWSSCELGTGGEAKREDRKGEERERNGERGWGETQKETRRPNKREKGERERERKWV